jgi:multiple sugar transport system substrate-binding protein
MKTGVWSFCRQGVLVGLGGLCLSSGASFISSANAQEGSLSVRGFSLPDEIASVRVEAFENQFPDVQLDLQEGSLDQQQLLTAVASGNPPDVIYLSRDALSTFATRGAIVPLTECIETQGIDMSQYREAAVSQVTVNDEVYGIPEFFNTIIVMLSNTALEEAGLTPDDVDTSDWEGLAQVNEQLTRAGNGNLERIGFDPKIPEFFPLWVVANGGQLLSDDGRTAQLNTPEAVEALEYTVQLHEVAGGRQDFTAFRDTWDFFGANNQITADQLAAFPIEQWYVNVMAEVSPDTPITIKAFTDRQGNPITFATGSAWAIPRGSENPEAACAFMKTMTAPETWAAAATARAAARSAEGLPFTGVYTGNRVADEEIFGTIRQDSGNAAFDDAVDVILSVQDQAFSIPANPAGSEFQQAWTDAVNRALNGEQSAADALNQAQQEAQAALDEAWQ